MLILPFILPFFHDSVCSVTFPHDFPHETPPNPKNKPSNEALLFQNRTQPADRLFVSSSRRETQRERERQRGGTATRHPHQHQLRYSLLSGAASLPGESFVRKYLGLVSARAHLCPRALHLAATRARGRAGRVRPPPRSDDPPLLSVEGLTGETRRDDAGAHKPPISTGD